MNFLYVFDKIKLNVIRYLLVSKFKYLSVYVVIYYGY